MIVGISVVLTLRSEKESDTSPAFVAGQSETWDEGGDETREKHDSRLVFCLGTMIMYLDAAANAAGYVQFRYGYSIKWS